MNHAHTSDPPKGRKSAVAHAALDILHDVLRPLRTHYQDQAVEEIAVCAPGLIFQRMRVPDRYGRLWRARQDPRLTLDYLYLVSHTLANCFDKGFGPPTRPTLFGVLPGNYRTTIAAGKGICYHEPIPQGGFAMSVRQTPLDDPNLTLEFYRKPTGALYTGRSQALRHLRHRSIDAAEALYEAALQGRPILFSGATGSGKTTIINLLLRDLNPDLRVVTIEDARELRVPVPNRVHILIPREEDDAVTEGTIAPKHLINLTTRITPDAIMVGEISTHNALMAVDVMSSGHTHFWTSIHAESPTEALEVFATRVRKSDPKEDPAALAAWLGTKFVVAQCVRDGPHRYISEIREPDDPATLGTRYLESDRTPLGPRPTYPHAENQRTHGSDRARERLVTDSIP